MLCDASPITYFVFYMVMSRFHSAPALKTYVHSGNRYTEFNLVTSLEFVMGKKVQGSSKYNLRRPNKIALAF